MQTPSPLRSVQSLLTAAEDVAKVKRDGEGQQGLPLSHIHAPLWNCCCVGWNTMRNLQSEPLNHTAPS